MKAQKRRNSPGLQVPLELPCLGGSAHRALCAGADGQAPARHTLLLRSARADLGSASHAFMLFLGLSEEERRKRAAPTNNPLPEH